MTYFLKNGNTYRVATKEAMDLHETLPAGNYVVKQMPMDGPLYLEQIDSFDSPKKMYGDVQSKTDRIIGTFLSRDKSTGVLLTGEKGSGKTMLSKNICIQLAAQHAVPTIVINAPWHGDMFNTFIQSIEQPCVVLFDEFEKVYDREQQESMLTLLDGIYSSKKLFLLTCNDKWRVDSHMRNRPGRIFYYLNFTGLDSEFIREYCEDNLKNKSHIDKLVSITSVFSAFNFDMLKATVEEMNRYDETPNQALTILNVKAEFDSGTSYEVEAYRGEHKAERLSPSIWTGTPLANDDISLNMFFKAPKGYDGDKPLIKGEVYSVEAPNIEYGWVDEEFAAGDLIKFDSKTGKFIFEKNGLTVILSRMKTRTYNFDAF
jgi:hypothetical protein